MTRKGEREKREKRERKKVWSLVRKEKKKTRRKSKLVEFFSLIIFFTSGRDL